MPELIEPNKSSLAVVSSPLRHSQSPLATLNYLDPKSLALRDGEVVIFRRSASPLWQCRFKRHDGSWERVSTKQASIEHAVRAACDLYDESRFRQRLGLAQKAPTFAQIAQASLHEMRRDLDAGIGKSVYGSYITCIERYFLPYFQDTRLEEITYTDIHEFEIWRNRQMNKVPKASTLMNFASAWTKLQQTAVNKGWISERVAIPKLTTRGVKGKTRPAFTRAEIDQLLAAMPEWTGQGRLAIERITRPLVRDYVEMLLYTGMRHGTEALAIRWQHVSWHTDKGVRYLRIWVDGKTGGRWLIAKHAAVAVLERLHARQSDIAGISFEQLLTSNCSQQVFRTSDLHQPTRMDGMFKRLLKDTGLLRTGNGQVGTLYSLRHTYATLELLENGTDIHTLARQTGNSVLMIERHYSKLTATLAGQQLA